jgi:toxin ParE1/3/4
MALTIELGGDARDALFAIDTHWRNHSTGAADKIIRAIGSSILLLSGHPWVGRSVQSAPYREKPVPRTPYIILYRLVGDTVLVLRIYDGRQNRSFPD